MTIPQPAALPAAGRTQRFATIRTISALILREMSTRYGRTPGGYLWSILEPLAGILFLSVGFSLIIRTPPLGNSFLLFYASGMLPFTLYQNLAAIIANAISFSKPLLKYPTVTWVDAIVARFILNSLTGILVTGILITGILIVIDRNAPINLVLAIEAMGLTMLVGLSMGTLNCVLQGLYPLWSVIWSIINRPLFLASGIFFLYEDLPPMAQNVLWYNPLIHITGLMRGAFYTTYTPSYINVTYIVLSSLVILTMGVILMGRYHRVILNR